MTTQIPGCSENMMGDEVQVCTPPPTSGVLHFTVRVQPQRELLEWPIGLLLERNCKPKFCSVLAQHTACLKSVLDLGMIGTVLIIMRGNERGGCLNGRGLIMDVTYANSSPAYLITARTWKCTRGLGETTALCILQLNTKGGNEHGYAIRPHESSRLHLFTPWVRQCPGSSHKPLPSGVLQQYTGYSTLNICVFFFLVSEMKTLATAAAVPTCMSHLTALTNQIK